MAHYEYGRITVLADQLQNAQVAPDIASRILEGAETVEKTSTAEEKARWMKGAMERMDALLDYETRRRVRESCACCLGGKREKISKQIARDHATLEGRIAAANEATFVFGHAVRRQDDGRILVSFCADDDPGPFRCVCLPKAPEPISPTYCLCCGGHIKHHLQNALGRKVQMEVRSSALSSAGREPCSFLFALDEPAADS